MNFKKVTNLIQLYKDYGFDYASIALLRRICNGRSDDYRAWIDINEQSEPERKLEYTPLISVVVPVYNVKEYQLVECIESVIQQTYSNWQLCLVDDASTIPNVREVLQRYEDNAKISVTFRKENGHISNCTNDGIAHAEGEFIAFLDCDDFLAPNALYEMALKLNENKELDFIYSDENLVTEDGKERYSPIFKPDWSPDTYLSHNYTNHFSLYRASIVKDIGGLRSEYNGSQDYDFVLRFSEKTSPNRIAHISKVLYHWRVRPESVTSGTDAKPYVFDAAKRATEDAIRRRSLNADIEYSEQTRQWNVVYNDSTNPLVSIIIITKDNSLMLKKTMCSISEHTLYDNYEFVIIDAGCKEEERAENKTLCEKYNAIYVQAKQDTNYAKLCNIGLHNGNGKDFVFLKDTLEVESETWLDRMVGHVAQSHIGVVGGKILYPGKQFIQSIGFLNLKSTFARCYDQKRNDKSLHTGLNNNFIAVSDACFMITKDKIDKYGEFDERFSEEYVVIEMCLRLLQNGFYNVYRPDVCFVNHIYDIEEQSSEEKKNQIVKDREQLFSSYPEYRKYDPFYAKNLSQVLPYSLDREENKTSAEKILKKTVIKTQMEYKFDFAYENQTLHFNGFIWSKSIKRTLWDQVWIKIVDKTGKVTYVKALKEYLYAYNMKKYNKFGVKWSGFSGSVYIDAELKDLQISILVVPVCSKKVYEQIVC